MTTSIAQLRQDLRNIGVAPGDTLMVHASLRAIGPTENRAEGLVQSLLAVLESQGTLLVYVDFQPTPEILYFDPLHSPASQDFGAFAEIVRTWPNAVRSLNPGASIAAIGARAEWICRDHPIHYGYGPGSPLAKLVELDGKVLLLGSDLNNVTILHHAEHLAQLPNKRIIRRVDKVLSDNTVLDLEIEEFDTSELVIDDMPEDYFSQVIREFVDLGRAKTATVGQAQSILLPTSQFVQFAVRKMEKEFGELPGSQDSG